jgi:hypothetical protein
MRILSTKVHGILDYLVGVILIAAPWVLGFAQNGAETWVPVILGAGAILYSLLTNYEMGVSKTISMRTHLALDIASGILLAASPWIFNFNDYVYLPHLVLGLGEILIASITERYPSYDRNHSRTGNTVNYRHQNV